MDNEAAEKSQRLTDAVSRELRDLADSVDCGDCNDPDTKLFDADAFWMEFENIKQLITGK